MSPFTPTEFRSALTSAGEQLQRVRTALGEITPPRISSRTINLRDLARESIEDLLDGVPSGYRKADRDIDYVYVIRLAEEDRPLISRMREQLDAARLLDKDYCRVNREHVDSITLYVGRSQHLKSRLAQHLGTDPRGVYSMHMQRWATVNDASIEMSYMKFENEEDLLIQAIEDGIWASLKPAFGRKGER